MTTARIYWAETQLTVAVARSASMAAVSGLFVQGVGDAVSGARPMTSVAYEKIAEPDVHLAMFFEGEFASGTVRLWTGLGDIDWNGHTWIGLGNLLAVSDIEETVKLFANGITVSLSGVPVEHVAAAINDAQQGLPGRCWIGFIDDDGSVIKDPIEAFAGRLDVPTIRDSATTCTVSVTYENRLVDMQQTREFRLTHESQKLFDPTDRGFEYVAAIQDQEVTWGR